MERLTRQVLDKDRVLDDLVQQTEEGTTDVVAQLLAQVRDGNAQ
ncbi:hypothetical protein [Streptomyces sp. S465]|nr:hypothetical protein [Streptomyces sp. S465]WAP61116.1 hypothetical protein N6H00_08675 [Streptomyces sp. S465]